METTVSQPAASGIAAASSREPRSRTTSAGGFFRLGSGAGSLRARLDVAADFADATATATAAGCASAAVAAHAAVPTTAAVGVADAWALLVADGAGPPAEPAAASAVVAPGLLSPGTL